MITQEKARAIAEEFRNASADPDDAARILLLIADNMQCDAAELSAAWNDRHAGACWKKAARKIEAAANILQEG